MMSCKDCDEETEKLDKIAYFRWGNANVGLVGCSKHLKEAIDVLREGCKRRMQESATPA